MSFVVLVVAGAQAGQVASFSELESILTDQLIVEDFEGLSLHDGGSYPVPNPLDPGNVSWGMEPGVTYASDEGLRLRNLQDDVRLEATGSAPNEMTLTFAEPQSAVGFSLGSFGQPATVTFYSDAMVLSSIDTSGSNQFVGWHEFFGITSVTIGANETIQINDVGWGAHETDTIPLPAPDGRGQTVPMLVLHLTPSGDELVTTWDVTSCPSSDYNLVYGRLVDVAAHTIFGSECGTGSGGSIEWMPTIPDDLFFLIIGIDDAGETESSWGVDSSGAERNGAFHSGQCGVIAKSLFGICP
ncbi:MAG: hypothetical protein GY722_10815 [bacterium]|nr:hypothetical protein [bacterium]